MVEWEQGKVVMQDPVRYNKDFDFHSDWNRSYLQIGAEESHGLTYISKASFCLLRTDEGEVGREVAEGERFLGSYCCKPDEWCGSLDEDVVGCVGMRMFWF